MERNKFNPSNLVKVVCSDSFDVFRRTRKLLEIGRNWIFFKIKWKVILTVRMNDLEWWSDQRCLKCDPFRQACERWVLEPDSTLLVKIQNSTPWFRHQRCRSSKENLDSCGSLKSFGDKNAILKIIRGFVGFFYFVKLVIKLHERVHPSPSSDVWAISNLLYVMN